jgi:hypothetical protein
MVLIAVIAGILALGATLSKGQEYEPYVKDTGVMVERAEICFSPDLGQPSIKLLNTWQQLVTELEIYERGGAKMNEEDALLGKHLADNAICGTTAAYYHIVITQDTEGYVLARYDEQYGFGVGSFIVAKKDVLLDRSI